MQVTGKRKWLSTAHSWLTVTQKGLGHLPNHQRLPTSVTALRMVGKSFSSSLNSRQIIPLLSLTGLPTGPHEFSNMPTKSRWGLNDEQLTKRMQLWCLHMNIFENLQKQCSENKPKQYRNRFGLTTANGTAQRSTNRPVHFSHYGYSIGTCTLELHLIRSIFLIKAYLICYLEKPKETENWRLPNLCWPIDNVPVTKYTKKRWKKYD